MTHHDYITVINEKDNYDPYDLNPETILIEDFDMIVNGNENTDLLQKIAKKFFNKSSKFFRENRKLIISSSSTTISMNNLISDSITSMFPGIKLNLDDDHDISNKMEFEFVKIKSQKEANNVLFSIIKKNQDQTFYILCNKTKNQQLIQLLSELNSMRFKLIDGSNPLGIKLESLKEFNSSQINVLISNENCLFGVNPEKIDNFIIYDQIDIVDSIRVLGRMNSFFSQVNGELTKKCYIFYKNKHYIEKLQSNYPIQNN